MRVLGFPRRRAFSVLKKRMYTLDRALLRDWSCGSLPEALVDSHYASMRVSDNFEGYSGSKKPCYVGGRFNRDAYVGNMERYLVWLGDESIVIADSPQRSKPGAPKPLRDRDRRYAERVVA